MLYPPVKLHEITQNSTQGMVQTRNWEHRNKDTRPG